VLREFTSGYTGNAICRSLAFRRTSGTTVSKKLVDLKGQSSNPLFDELAEWNNALGERSPNSTTSL
jgi:hypothetical protein